jgi:hypothetical protein
MNVNVKVDSDKDTPHFLHKIASKLQKGEENDQNAEIFERDWLANLMLQRVLRERTQGGRVRGFKGAKQRSLRVGRAPRHQSLIGIRCANKDRRRAPKTFNASACAGSPVRCRQQRRDRQVEIVNECREP